MAKFENDFFNAPIFYSFGSINLPTVKYCTCDYLTCGLVHCSVSQTEHTFRELGLLVVTDTKNCSQCPHVR